MFINRMKKMVINQMMMMMKNLMKVTTMKAT